MSNHLHDRLAELADDAPLAASDPADLWARGVRRQRRRRAAYAGAGVAAALALVAGVALGGQLVGESAEPRPAVPPVSELHLPDRILRPDPWSEGTAEAGEIGPLAAIGQGDRLTPRGISDETMDNLALFGVSAADGTTRFLDLPFDEQQGEGMPYSENVALSPDGRWVAYEVRLADVRSQGIGVRLTGWRLYDTVTGQTVDVTDPERPEVWSSGSDIGFTADSRYLLTSYLFHGPSNAEATHGLVAWDVATGERIVLEEPGAYWEPILGSAPRGLLVARKFQVRHLDPASGEVERFRLPKAVVSPSTGPDGKAFAYVGGDWTPGKNGGINARTWRLYVGPDRDHLRRIVLPTDGRDTDAIMGWRDARHVIVGSWNGGYFAEVDVVTGEPRTFRVPGHGGGPATIANDLWANDLVPAVEPPDAGDPRTPWKIAMAVGVGLGLVGLLLLRWRRRRAA